jgi:hypothetical protein
VQGGRWCCSRWVPEPFSAPSICSPCAAFICSEIRSLRHCTLALTEAALFATNVQLVVFLPALEHAPDQMALRPLATVNVMDVPVANGADPLLPTVTLSPAGVDTMRSPLRPEADTVTVTFCGGGGGGVAAVTVAVVVCDMPLYVAVIVTEVVVLTVEVATVKPAAVAPAPTVTLAGRLATPGLLLDRETTAPPAGAPPDNDTNAEVFAPPATLDGLTVTLCRVGPALAGVTVSVALRVEPFSVAVIVTSVLAATADVETTNVPVKPFGATVVVAGTLATAGLLLDREITPPSVAATSVTAVPLDPSPPTTVEGLRPRVESCAGGGAACGVKLRTADHAPATPAELTPRTRQKFVVVASPDVEYCDAVTLWSRTNGAVNALESSI